MTLGFIERCSCLFGELNGVVSLTTHFFLSTVILAAFLSNLQRRLLLKLKLLIFYISLPLSSVAPSETI